MTKIRAPDRTQNGALTNQAQPDDQPSFLPLSVHGKHCRSCRHNNDNMAATTSIDKVESDATSDDRSPAASEEEDTCAAVVDDSPEAKPKGRCFFWSRRPSCLAATVLLLVVVLSLLGGIAFVAIENPFQSNRSSSSAASTETTATNDADAANEATATATPIASNLINVTSPTVTPVAEPSTNGDTGGQTEDEDEFQTKAPAAASAAAAAPTLKPSTTTAVISVDVDETVAPVSSYPSVAPSNRPVVRPVVLNATSAPTAAATTAPPSMAPTSPALQSIFINAGGPLYTDSQGNVWQNDTAYTTTGVTDEGCPSVNTDVATPIDLPLYCTGRIHTSGYNIPVPNNVYVVTLHFFETDTDEQFDVFIEGIKVFRELGEREDDSLVYAMTAHADVKDGSLTIAFVKNVGNIRISAIEVHPVTDADSVFSGDLPTANLTYIPGQLTVEEQGLILSEGLTAKLIAAAGRALELSNGDRSVLPFHVYPDAAATFVDTRAGNEGGWIYVSNSEADPSNVDSGEEFPGGVGAITFNALGEVIDYSLVLDNTRMNCGGGRTPWGSWISGEEYDEGRIYQVDPTGQRMGEPITMGETYRGKFESFAYDARDTSKPRFFMTKDDDFGELRRFTPTSPDWNDPWTILSGPGSLDFLVLDKTGVDSGTFQWDPEQSRGSASAGIHFPGAEGIDVPTDSSSLYFISKVYKSMFILNLDNGTYTNYTTEQGLFDGQSDQLVHIIDDASSDSILYFTEDGGSYAGIHGRNQAGQYFTILESHEYPDETTGLSFSPDSKHMYIAYQDNGFLFDISRVDGMAFNARTLNVKYHNIDMR